MSSSTFLSFLITVRLFAIAAPGEWNEAKLIEIAQLPTKKERKIASGYKNAPLWIRYFQSPGARTRQVRTVFHNK